MYYVISAAVSRRGADGMGLVSQLRPSPVKVLSANISYIVLKNIMIDQTTKTFIHIFFKIKTRTN